MLILGSKSKARFELLKLYNAEIKVMVADIDEVFDDRLTISDNVKKIAFEKGQALLKRSDLSEDILICADTVVVANNECLQKPINYEDAFRMIKALSNNKIEVITGVYLKYGVKVYNFSESSFIAFDNINDQTINAYLKDNSQYLNISGALDIEKIDNYINYTVEGSFSNIIGLPMKRISELLYDSSSSHDAIVHNEKSEKIDIYRSSVRVIAQENNKVVLLKGYTFDKKHIFYHTIGGGYHNQEDKITVLKKEAIEEGGLIMENIQPLIIVNEHNISARNNNYNKMSVHSYYSADIIDYCDVNYIEYEADLLLGIEYFSIDQAIELIEKQIMMFKDTDYPIKGMSFSDLNALQEYRGKKYDNRI